MSRALSPRRSALTLLVAGLILLAVPARLRAESAEDLDKLNEDLRVATARAQYALEKLRGLDYALGGEDRRARRDILSEGRALFAQAATVAWEDSESIHAVIDALAAVRARADNFLETVAPAWEKQRRSTRERTYRSPFQEILKFRDVAEDVESRRDALNEAEYAQAQELMRDGAETVGVIKETRESDHAERDRQVRHLMEVRDGLSALLAKSESKRQPGHVFIAQSRTRQQWTDLGYQENGFTALRTRFVQPQSAFVTVRNDGDERRPLFIEIQFFDVGGDRTGEGVFETPPLDELRPGEVREVLVPIFPSHPRFWDATRSFTVYLD